MGLPTPAGLPSPTRKNGDAMIGTWSGGKMIVVPDVQGNSLISKEIADRQCQLQVCSDRLPLNFAIMPNR